MPTQTKASDAIICDGCWGTPELRPSGTSFSRHEAADGSRCSGKPVLPVKGGDVKTLATCPECGKQGKALKNGRLLKHEHEGKTCEQREGISAVCATCSRRIGLKSGKFVNHKNTALNTKCGGTGLSAGHVAVTPFDGARKPGDKPAKTPRPKKAPAPKGVDAAWTKAQVFASTIAPHGWATEVDVNKAQLTATALAQRGEETITITWEEARCVGGTIFHTFRSRTIALRNKNAAVQRAAMNKDQIIAEHSRVAARTAPKPARGPRKQVERTTEERKALRNLLPFDPREASETEIAKAIAGQKLRWTNRTSGKEEMGLVNKNTRAIKLAQSKADGSRQVTFFLEGSGAKTIRLADLLSVG